LNGLNHLIEVSTTFYFLSGTFKKELHPNTPCIKLLENFCTVVLTKNYLFESVFPVILNNYLDQNWLSKRAILAPKNDNVDKINLFEHGRRSSRGGFYDLIKN